MAKLSGGTFLLNLVALGAVLTSDTAFTITNKEVLSQLKNLTKLLDEPECAKPVKIRYLTGIAGGVIQNEIFANMRVVSSSHSIYILGIDDRTTIKLDVSWESVEQEDGSYEWEFDDVYCTIQLTQNFISSQASKGGSVDRAIVVDDIDFTKDDFGTGAGKLPEEEEIDLTDSKVTLYTNTLKSFIKRGYVIHANSVLKLSTVYKSSNIVLTATFGEYYADAGYSVRIDVSINSDSKTYSVNIAEV